MKNQKKKGFTLTELIVVIVIIGVLAAVLIPSLTGYITKAQDAKDETLVASLNKTYANSKIIEDDLYFYTAYDVKEFLKSIEMENVEVANKKNLILFDTSEDKFVLIKEDSEYLGETTYGSHTSEFYTIRNNYYGASTTGVTEEPTYNRSFIVSTSGNVISEVVAMYMNIENVSESECQDYITKMLAKLSDKKYSSLKKHLVDDLSKTLFMSEENGEGKAFYIGLDYNYNFFENLDMFSNPINQKISRVVIMPSVNNVRIDVVEKLKNSVLVLPNFVSEATLPNISKIDNIEIYGNTKIINVKDSGIDISKCLNDNVEVAYKKAKIKELINVDNEVENEQELRDAMNTYYQLKFTKTIIEELDNLAKVDSNYKDSTKILNDLSKIIIKNTFEIKNDLDIYVTLEIPYDDEGNISSDGDTIKGFAHLDDGFKKYDLIIGKDAIVNVYANIEVGGITGRKTTGLSGNTSSYYSKITVNGTMILNEGVDLNVYGYIMGEGNIIVEKGATLTQPFVIGDYNGGTNTTILAEKKRMPFVKYTLCNVQCNVKINYGGLYQGITKLWQNGLNLYSITILAGYMGKDSKIVFIGYKDISDSNNSKLGMFNLADNNSYIEISYDNEKKLTEGDAFDTNVGRSEYKIYGNVETGSIQLDIKFGLKNIPIDTDSYDLCIPYNFDIEFHSGTCTVNSNIVLLQGAKVEVANGAEIIIKENKKLLISSANAESVGYSGKDFKYPSSETLKKSNYDIEGKLINNGKIVVEGVCGGKIYTEGNEYNNIIIKIKTTATIENITITLGAEPTDKCSINQKKYNNQKYTLSFENTIAIGKSDNSTILEKGEKYVYSSDGKWIKETETKVE